MTSTYPPCAADDHCYRNDDHDGPHAYAEGVAPGNAVVPDLPERLAADFALLVGGAYPATYPDLLALEADLLRFLRENLPSRSAPSAFVEDWSDPAMDVYDAAYPRHGVIEYDDQDLWLTESDGEGAHQIVARDVPRWLGRLIVKRLAE